MVAPWENMPHAELRVERNPQGKIIYRGPRVGVLIHSSHKIAINLRTILEKTSNKSSLERTPGRYR
jgi:hypothetical protein